jgi:hypothetical protein
VGGNRYFRVIGAGSRLYLAHLSMENCAVGQPETIPGFSGLIVAGGAVLNEGGQVVAEDVQIRNNSVNAINSINGSSDASAFGGGICSVNGSVALTGVSLMGNRVSYQRTWARVGTCDCSTD